MKYDFVTLRGSNVFSKGGVKNLIAGGNLSSWPHFLDAVNDIEDHGVSLKGTGAFLGGWDSVNLRKKIERLQNLLQKDLKDYVALCYHPTEYLNSSASGSFDTLFITSNRIIAGESSDLDNGMDGTHIDVVDVFDTNIEKGYEFLSSNNKSFCVLLIRKKEGEVGFLVPSDNGKISIDFAENDVTLVQHLNDQTEKQEENMSKVQAIVNANKNAAVSAAKLEAGRIALRQVTKAVQGKAPLVVRGYLDTPLGRVVVANIFSLAVEQYASNNKLAKDLASASLQAAALEVVQSFNIAELIDDVIQGVGKDKLDAF